jgi:hypothetical protein
VCIGVTVAGLLCLVSACSDPSVSDTNDGTLGVGGSNAMGGATPDPDSAGSQAGSSLGGGNGANSIASAGASTAPGGGNAGGGMGTLEPADDWYPCEPSTAPLARAPA